MAHRSMKFGIFLAPFHRVGENPTLAIDRDMELIEWFDHLGYDEVWFMARTTGAADAGPAPDGA